MKQTQRGFTLIELMIVVTIIAIIASVGYPSYRQYVKRSARAEAKTALLENAQFLERNYTAANRYNQDSAGNDITDADLPVTQSPKDGGGKYTIVVVDGDDSPTASTFVLRAIPVAGGPMDNDECGTLTLSNAGVKDVTGSKPATECWGK
ncbi:type IV pilus assembly protein PilE [Povalibacter uvarum]|uniref:Type IV pilus assembly protein PilE n=1 Tax=Povalibacter uvarum TaxID=732238 RepID=A0A841HI27_9GAMM|nr:type IV pilin protein [Povalibacter uvarum]MBB6091842.1 type IV pilus assembly protein PilE [Povalibacter uvarum]